MKKDYLGIISDKVGNDLARIYDKSFIDSLTHRPTWMPEIVGYKNVRVPRYLEIRVPVIEKHYRDFDDGMEYEGLLITTRTIRICKFGWKYEKQPIYKKQIRKSIRFIRYSNLKVDDIKNLVKKLNTKVKTAKRS